MNFYQLHFLNIYLIFIPHPTQHSATWPFRRLTRVAEDIAARVYSLNLGIGDFRTNDLTQQSYKNTRTHNQTHLCHYGWFSL